MKELLWQCGCNYSATNVKDEVNHGRQATQVHRVIEKRRTKFAISNQTLDIESIEARCQWEVFGSKVDLMGME